LERGVWRGAGYRCRSSTGGCCGCWNVGRNGRCFGAGNRCCCGRRHKSRSGSRAGSSSDMRTGCGSGRRCSTGTWCCWGSSTGGRCEGRAWGRSVGCCSGRNGCCFRGCAGRRNEGRVGGNDSPCCPGDGRAEAIQSAGCRVQNGGTIGKETTWDQRRTKDDARRYERCYVLGLKIL